MSFRFIYMSSKREAKVKFLSKLLVTIYHEDLPIKQNIKWLNISFL